MKVVVTGAAGFLGGHIARNFRDVGWEVTAFDVAPFQEDGIQFAQGDLTDGNSVDQAVAGADVVAHVGAIGDVYLAGEQPTLAAEVNVLGTANVIEAALRHDARDGLCLDLGGLRGAALRASRRGASHHARPSVQHHQARWRVADPGSHPSPRRSPLSPSGWAPPMGRACAPTRSSGSSSTAPGAGSRSRSRETDHRDVSSPTPRTSPGPSHSPPTQMSRGSLSTPWPRTPSRSRSWPSRSSAASRPSSPSGSPDRETCLRRRCRRNGPKRSSGGRPRCRSTEGSEN